MDSTDYNALLKNALLRLETMQIELDNLRRADQQFRDEVEQLHEPLAVIGMSCRLPGGVKSPDDFWQLLLNGGDTSSEIPPNRWDVDSFYDPDPSIPGKMYTRFGSFIEDPELFDPQFFSISPREATSLDPQQRLLLETTWQALENANIAPESLQGSQTGVFVGISNGEYISTALSAWKKEVLNRVDPYFGTGNAFSTASGRLSYTLRLVGPNLAVDTACSSSLSAVYLAAQSLRTGKCNLALAGGVNMIFSPAVHITFSKARMLSPDGHCKTFDAAADGYLRGEGCGMIVLKRLSDAQRDGDQVLALIRGAAMNQDGASSGLTVPSGPSQQAVVRQALADADVTPEQISYVEAHGTGTFLGDPIEAGALAEVFGAHHDDSNPLYIGSVKTNIGHLESAAGISGLIKLILSMQHRQIPRNLHFKQLNPNIPWQGLALHVPTQHMNWQAERRIAGISGFGFGGTNVHLVLEEAPPAKAPRGESPLADESEFHRPQVLCLSARTEQALQAMAGQYAAFLETIAPRDWASVCYTAHHHRSLFRYRLAVVAEDPLEAAASLRSFSAGQRVPNLFNGQPSEAARPRLAFLFTGQGSQYAGMGRDLYESEPVFRQHLDECSALLGKIQDHTLLEVLFPEAGQEHLINDTIYTQPALFALEYSLAQLLSSWNIQPDIMMGHSIGEYVAACLAGIFSVEEGLRLVAARARLMSSLPHNGRMLTIFASPAQVEAELQALRQAGEPLSLSIAAINSPENVVISGMDEAVAAFAVRLAEHGIRSEALQVSHAFHSPLMEPILEPFHQIATTIHYSPPQRRLISNLYGNLASEENAWAQSADYWSEHIRQGVQFMAGMQSMQQLGVGFYLEVGPRPALTGLGRQCLGDAAQAATWTPTLRPGKRDRSQLAACLAQLFVAGFPVQWSNFDQRNGQEVHRLSLPNYPFQRQRYWIADPDPLSSEAAQSAEVEAHPLLGKALDLAGTPGLVFENFIGPRSPGYLSDHRLFHQVVFPGSAFFEMAIAAGKAYFPADQNLVILQARIQQPLIFSGSEPYQVQTVLTPLPDGSAELTIYSKLPASGWQRHLSAVLQSGSFPAPTAAPLLAELHSPDGTWLRAGQDGPEKSVFYQQRSLQGYEYGMAFQTLEDLRYFQLAEEPAYCARVRLPRSLSPEAYTWHPALLDGVLQPLAALSTHPSLMPLPIAFQRLAFHVPLASAAVDELSVYLRITPTAAPDLAENAPKIAIEIYLYNTSGTLLASGAGELTEVSRMAFFRLLEKDFNKWFYNLEWAPVETLTQEKTHSKSGRGQWLLYADEQGVAAGLAQRLQAAGDRIVLVTPGAPGSGLKTTEATEAIQGYMLDPLDRDGWQALASGLRSLPLKGMIHLSNLDIRSGLNNLAENISTLQEQSLAGLLHLIQAASLEYGVRAPRLWIVSRGAWQVTPEQSRLEPFQALCWGLARSTINEHSEFQCVALDLDPDAPDPQKQSEFIYQMLQDQDSREDMLALRAGQRYGLRIQPGWPGYAARPPGSAYHLTIGEYGLLEFLRLAPLQRTLPGPDEVEIEVRAAGLNLRDVLNALGMLRQFAAELGIDAAQELPFGGECAGVITALGENTAGKFKIGDAVIAGLAIGSLASHVKARVEAVVVKPQQLSFEEAATLPTAGLTAYYGLHTLAGIQPGEKVLIHAAAGGVGQAAVQIARRAGAEIFATASPSKWDFLRAQGIEHVYNSRTLDFQQQLLADTTGQGVEIVLNSLSGEFIPASLAVLGQGGRFIEIGKLGIMSPEYFNEQRPDAAYFPFDLLEVAQANLLTIQNAFAELHALWIDGQIKPLPYRVFPLTQAAEAFRFMAQARHIGKIILVPPGSPVAIRPEAVYLISGGLGGLGLQIAHWLIYQGARHLLLLGRSGAASPEAQAAVDMLQALGAEVQAVACDVADPAAVELLVAQTSAGPHPLAGIIHAAGINEIAPLRHYPWQDFARQLRPKVAGTWNLHQATLGLPLDFFICFSSMSALVPTAGQASYSASNLFMDSLMQARRAAGLVGASINWGPWAEVGMVPRLEAHLQQGQLAAGLSPFSNAGGKMAFEAVMERVIAPKSGPEGLGQMYVFDMDWQKFASFAPALANSPALSAVVTANPAASHRRGDLLEKLKALPVDERKPFLFKTVQQELANILNLAVTNIERHQRLLDFGMDSLMAIEFKNSLEISLACSLPATMVFDYPTVGEVADFLVDEMLALDSPPAGVQKQTDSTDEILQPAGPAAERLEVLAEIKPVNNEELAGCLVPLQANGPGRPFFCVHPIGGQILCYRDLAELLGPGQPFYAVQAVGASGSEAPLANIEQMAARYISEIQTLQPHGPYRLGGWSLGGVVAFEMARLLRQSNEETSLLALIDSYLPNPAELKQIRQAAALTNADELGWLAAFAADLGSYNGVELAIPQEHLRPWPRREQIRQVWLAAREAGALSAGVGLESLTVQWNLYRSHRLALLDYFQALNLQTYAGAVHLYRAEQSSGGLSNRAAGGRKQRWERHLSGKLSETILPGDHYSILRSPGLHILANSLRAEIEQDARRAA